MKLLKKIPKFKNEDEEREFWDTVDTSEYFDMENGIHVEFPNLIPTYATKPITIRMPGELIQKIKKAADKRDVPYQSLIKVWLADRVAEETPEYGKKSKSNKKSK